MRLIFCQGMWFAWRVLPIWQVYKEQRRMEVGSRSRISRAYIQILVFVHFSFAFFWACEFKWSVMLGQWKKFVILLCSATSIVWAIPRKFTSIFNFHNLRKSIRYILKHRPNWVSCRGELHGSKRDQSCRHLLPSVHQSSFGCPGVQWSDSALDLRHDCQRLQEDLLAGLLGHREFIQKWICLSRYVQQTRQDEHNPC